MIHASRITTPAGEEMVLLSLADYDRLTEAAEQLADIAAYDEFKQRLAAGEEEMLPAEMVNRLVAGESPLRVWREHRGLSARELAERAGLSQAFVSQIETGKREGSLTSMSALARALGITLDDLAP